MSENLNINDKGSIYSFSQEDFPAIEEIKYLILDKGAKVENILNAVMLRLSGILVDEETKIILDSFRLPSHKYYPTYVKDTQNEVYKYFWLQTSNERERGEFLDYEKTEFYLQKDILGLEKEMIKIDSENHLRVLQEKLELGQAIKVRKAVLRKEFLRHDFDLFKIGMLSVNWIISELLMEALASSSISGVIFKKIENLFIEEN